jgi:NAD(P)-dependent dehydrogenase (short-subunit alcohol dehydrogenase family)
MQRLFPSKMTAFGIKQAGEETFNAEQPTGVFLSPFFNFRTLLNLSHDMLFIAPLYVPQLTFLSGRFGMPSDIAGLALFLSSPASAHITGTHTLLDGGSRFRRHAVAPALKL